MAVRASSTLPFFPFPVICYLKLWLDDGITEMLETGMEMIGSNVRVIP
jgi:predicted patatin/cPLA2 family phospholipase